MLRNEVHTAASSASPLAGALKGFLACESRGLMSLETAAVWVLLVNPQATARQRELWVQCNPWMGVPAEDGRSLCKRWASLLA